MSFTHTIEFDEIIHDTRRSQIHDMSKFRDNMSRANPILYSEIRRLLGKGYTTKQIKTMITNLVSDWHQDIDNRNWDLG